MSPGSAPSASNISGLNMPRDLPDFPSAFQPQEFHYRLPWRTRGVHAGGHHTRMQGGNADFQGYASLLACPDPRRLDIRASMRTIPHQLMVRTYHERGAATLYAVVDLSASMGFNGHADKRRLVAEIVASIAWSAARSGDAFGMLGCDDTLRMDVHQPPSFRRNMAANVYTHLMQVAYSPNSGVSALPQSLRGIGGKRSLVFLVSDFHWPLALLNDSLRALSAHDVVPVVLWDSSEFADVPAWGWAQLRDMETGRDMPLFMRPSLLQRLRQGYAQRRQLLAGICRQAGARSPFFVQDSYSAEQLSRHLLEQC